MAQSYLTENEAPRDFRISSTESESNYTKCILCYTIKKHFYCVECIKAGNFVHSSMPYSDRFADKQAKLMRIKANRKHVQNRCETLLLSKSRKDTLHTQLKQHKDKIDLIKLAIEQRKKNIEDKKAELLALKQYNVELSLKLPRYQKRVASLGKHTQVQRIELENKTSLCEEKIESLAALRRERIRQLTRYIFPIYYTYDSSDSVEDMEFLQMETEESPVHRERLHIISAWLPAHGDYTQVQNSLSPSPPGPGEVFPPHARPAAALRLAAQLLALLAWTLDVRLPYALSLSDSPPHRLWGSMVSGAGWLVGVAGLAGAGGEGREGAGPTPAALRAIVNAAEEDLHELGRPPVPVPGRCVWWGGGGGGADLDDEPPEHLHWPDIDEVEEISSSPPAPGPSLVTSAAASLASIWRGWTK